MKYYMNITTGSVDTYDGWFYENEEGETVNGVDLGEVVEVIKNEDGDWVEFSEVEEMTREQAVERMGLEMVESAESDNCEFRSRNEFGEERWEGRSFRNEDGEVCVAVYYMQQEETEVEDLGSLTWIIDHYEIA